MVYHPYCPPSGSATGRHVQVMVINGFYDNGDRFPLMLHCKNYVPPAFILVNLRTRGRPLGKVR